MEVDILASRVSDNFFYAVHADGEAALIDPVDGSGAVDWVRDQGVELRYVVNTHFHRDHTGGNPTVLGDFPGANLVAPSGDADRIRGQLPEGRDRIDLIVEDGDTLELGGAEFTIHETAGHTAGHMSLHHGDHLFCGDTVFVGGAGNCNFGGDVGDLFETFRETLPAFDDDVIFYPGHDYSVRDLEFITSLEPGNERAEELLERARETPEDELFTTTLGDERAYSPFFRWEDETLRDRLRSDHPDVWQRSEEQARSGAEATFRAVRALRDEW